MPTTPTKGGREGGGPGGGDPLRPPPARPAHPSEGAYLLDKKPTRGIPNRPPLRGGGPRTLGESR